MTDEQFDDLKQYIDSRAAQTEARFDDQFDGANGEISQLKSAVGQLKNDIQELRSEVSEGFLAVGETFDDVFAMIDERLPLTKAKPVKPSA